MIICAQSCCIIFCKLYADHSFTQFSNLWCAGATSWASELTQHKLTHTSIWDYTARGLTLLSNLCGLSALVKDVADALQQVAIISASTSHFGPPL